MPFISINSTRPWPMDVAWKWVFPSITSQVQSHNHTITPTKSSYSTTIFSWEQPPTAFFFLTLSLCLLPSIYGFFLILFHILTITGGTLGSFTTLARRARSFRKETARRVIHARLLMACLSVGSTLLVTKLTLARMGPVDADEYVSSLTRRSGSRFFLSKLLSDVVGLLNSRLWSLWSPSLEGTLNMEKESIHLDLRLHVGWWKMGLWCGYDIYMHGKVYGVAMTLLQYGKWACGVVDVSPFPFVSSLDYACTRLANDNKAIRLFFFYNYFSSTFDAKNLIFKILILR